MTAGPASAPAAADKFGTLMSSHPSLISLALFHPDSFQLNLFRCLHFTWLHSVCDMTTTAQMAKQRAGKLLGFRLWPHLGRIVGCKLAMHLMAAELSD
jgi:hypothetical protein